MNTTVLKGLSGLLVLGLLGAAFWSLRDQFLVNPFQPELPFEYPSFAAADGQGNTYLIDRSLKRVSKTLADGTLAWAVTGGSRESGSFFFADELSVDGQGNVYVLNRVPDAPGFYTVLSQVLRYGPDGRFLGVIAQRAYTDQERLPTLVQRGQWHSLQARGPLVQWFDSSTTALTLYTGENGTVTATPVWSPYAADLLVPAAAVLPDGRVVSVTKQGRIERREADGTRSVLFDASRRSAGAMPWKLRSLADGRLFFTDLVRNGVAEVLPDGTAPLRFGTDGLTTYTLSADASGVLGTSGGDDGPKLFSADGKARPLPSAARYSIGAWAVHVALWLALAAALTVLVLLMRLVYVDVFRRSLPTFFKTVAGVVAVTAIVGALVAAMILNNFSQRYSSEVLSKITQLVHLVPRILDPAKVQAVSEPAEFAGPEYLALRQQIITAIYGEKNDDNQWLYFALHKVGPGGLTTFMYLNGDTTVSHPFSYLNTPDGPYQKALKGETVALYTPDAWGNWMYGTGPLRNAQGQIIGVFEMGGDLYSFTQENNRLIQSLMVNILTVLVIFLLILVELTFLQDQLRKRDLGRALAEQGVTARRGEDEFHRVYLVRAVTGLFFVSASVSLMFLPLMMKGFYQPLWGLPENVVYALPVSLRLFFFGLGTIVGGNFTRRWGWRPVFLAGLAVSGAGLTAAALSTEMNLFLISSVAIGLGAGLAMIGLRALVNAEGGPETKAPAYGHFYAGIVAGTNVGVILGSGLADLIGFANVFWLALLLTAATLAAVLQLFPQPAKTAPGAAGELSAGKALRLYFLNPAIARFTVLIVLPVYVASMVLYFFLPVFAEAKGVSNADIGRIFLLNGLVIVYLGPALSRLFQRRLGTRRSLLASSLLWAACLVPFVVLGDLWGLIFTVVLMGLAEGAAAVAQNEHMMALPVVSQVGTDRAAGYFEVVGKVGETVAPVVIGFAMLLGPQTGIGLVAALVAGALLVFWVADGAFWRRGAAA